MVYFDIIGSSLCGDSNWIYNGTKCYYIHDTNVAFGEGRQICQAKGGQMVGIMKPLPRLH